MMQEPTSVPIVLPPLQRIACSLMISSSHSLSVSRVGAFSKCHSPPGADGFPFSVFKVSFPWWRHLFLSFFNLILRFAVPSTW